MSTSRRWRCPPGALLVRSGLTGAAVAQMCLCSTPASVFAEELRVDASVQDTVLYSSNIPLSPIRESGWGDNLGASVSLSRRSETNQLSAGVGLALNRYTDPKFNTNDAFVSLSEYQQLERDQLGIVAQYALQSYRAAQLAQTGLNLGYQQVETLVVTPQWSRSLTERLSSTLAVSYSQAHYDTPGLVNYWSPGAALSLNYTASERLTAGVTFSYAKFNTTPFTSSSETWGTTVNASYLATENLTLLASVGGEHVRTEQQETILVCPTEALLCQLGLVQYIPVGAVGTSEQFVVPYSVGLKWRMSETQDLEASASQQVLPNGTGALLGSKQFVAIYRQALSATWNFTLLVNYTISTFLSGAHISNYLAVSPSVGWQIDEAWSANAGYSFLQSTGYGVPSAQANVVFATIRYAWPLLSTSH